MLDNKIYDRSRWRAISIEKFTNKEYRFGRTDSGDLEEEVRYLVKFAGTWETISIDRKTLLRIRPRGYQRQLLEFDRQDHYQVDQVLCRELREGQPYYYVKFFKHPTSDNTWIDAQTIENFHYCETLHLHGALIGKKFLEKPITTGSPNDKFKNKDN